MNLTFYIVGRMDCHMYIATAYS